MLSNTMNPILKSLGLYVLLAGFTATQSLFAQNLPITAAEAEKLSIQLDTSVSNGNPEIFNQLISFPAFISRLKSKSSLIDNVDTLTKIASGYGLFNIGNRVVEIVRNGSYHLLRGYKKDDELHLLFRAFGDGGLDYQDITLVKVKDEVKAADIFSYQLGEPYSSLFSALIADKEPMDQHMSLTPKEKYVGLFETALNHKNYSAARSAFEKLDEQTQNEKHLYLQYMMACQHLDLKLYKKAVDHYAELFPDEPASYLFLTSIFMNTKEYNRFGMALDRLDSLLSIDPFLNYFRGNIVMKLGKAVAARDYYQLAFDYDPSIWQNTQKLVECKVTINELVQANEVINVYKHTPGYRKDLVEILYADYPVLK
jgi:tetratricopeptide (TPR) repeat protein